MKKIEALINPSKIETVKGGLSKIGINCMTILEAKYCDGHTTRSGMYRGTNYTTDFLPKVKVEVVVDDEQAEAVIGVMAKTSGAADNADSNICVSTVERGNLALA
ncbi:MAG TPA: P-II family nitrogen regulator [Candidatus Cybelea sp.]|nr:P-II family nitrogen regulator [Candidatus Cybelea sp.]